MKKDLLGALTRALVLTAACASVFADGQDHGFGLGSGSCGGAGMNCHYTDADGDGVCDYQGTNCRYTDADGDGVCDYRGTGCRSGLGVGFVDEDGDGVCDNLSTGCRPMDGTGRGHHGGRNR